LMRGIRGDISSMQKRNACVSCLYACICYTERKYMDTHTHIYFLTYQKIMFTISHVISTSNGLMFSLLISGNLYAFPQSYHTKQSRYVTTKFAAASRFRIQKHRHKQTDRHGTWKRGKKSGGKWVPL